MLGCVCFGVGELLLLVLSGCGASGLGVWAWLSDKAAVKRCKHDKGSMDTCKREG